jgi:pimeloyl-ACP methyl ester carboxylesterase
MWQLAEDLSDEFMVLEPLQRQHADRPLTVDVHVRDLAQVLQGPTHIVGHSWGAMLALSFASQHPSLTRSITLLGCGTYDSTSRDEYHRALRERLGPQGRLEYDDLERRSRAVVDDSERDQLRRARAVLSMRAQAVDPLHMATSDEPGPDPLAGGDEWRGDARGADQTWADVVRLQAEGIEPQRFSGITAPVLMLHGDADPHPGRMIARSLGVHIPHLEYIELALCGHTPWEERNARDACLALLRRFLRS